MDLRNQNQEIVLNLLPPGQYCLHCFRMGTFKGQVRIQNFFLCCADWIKQCVSEHWESLQQLSIMLVKLHSPPHVSFRLFSYQTTAVQRPILMSGSETGPGAKEGISGCCLEKALSQHRLLILTDCCTSLITISASSSLLLSGRAFRLSPLYWHLIERKRRACFVYPLSCRDRGDAKCDRARRRVLGGWRRYHRGWGQSWGRTTYLAFGN